MTNKTCFPALKRNGAFTLIELLVVIAIIAILAAILFPVFESAREKAKQSTCASNEKQLGLAFLQYVQDFDETFPYANYNEGGNGMSWATRIGPYVKASGAYTCPDDQYTSVIASGILKTVVSYGMNLNVNDYAAYGKSWPLQSQSNAPSVTVLLFEVSGVNSDTTSSTNKQDFSQYGDGGDKNSGYSPSVGGMNINYAKYDTGDMGQHVHPNGVDDTHFPLGRHTDGSNFLLEDGHVKWMKGSGVSPGYAATGSNCDQDACPQPGWGYGNAAGTGFVGTAPKSFGATFSPI